MKKVLFLFLIVLILNACSKRMFMGKRDWSWLKTRYSSGETIEPAEKDVFVLTLNFRNNKFNAETDCNRFSGDFAIDESRFELKSINSTRMRCAESQERAFIDEFIKTTRFSMDEDNLELFTENATLFFN